MNPEVKKFHAYLTEMCRNAEFGQAVSATNYAVEGVAQKISEKALRGLAKNEKIGPRGRWWLEEHAKYDDEHPIHALEIIKDCVKRGGNDTPEKVTQCALESLGLMKVSMEASYHA
jgi:pyrroloquinoline quinone (PQQ) biosynthesis protein C